VDSRSGLRVEFAVECDFEPVTEEDFVALVEAKDVRILSSGGARGIYVVVLRESVCMG
jgi:hypothetical protein